MCCPVDGPKSSQARAKVSFYVCKLLLSGPVRVVVIVLVVVAMQVSGTCSLDCCFCIFGKSYYFFLLLFGLTLSLLESECHNNSIDNIIHNGKLNQELNSQTNTTHTITTDEYIIISRCNHHQQQHNH